ncbi:MAG: threonylcarbamoyl-AMP synthase [Curvibacter sp.]|nr:threonylcarbamoyl-AMP synthase [Curvibacter sp.]
MILDGHDPVSIERAAQALAAGELIGLPTETVYGLAADAGSDGAVAKIFSAKGRPSDHPLIVHLASAAEVPAFAAQVPDFAQALMDAFWPGPLTLILPRRAEAGGAAAGGQDSIGLRCPSHPVAHALLTACARLGVMGLAAPSANLFGRVSPTTAGHVEGEFGDGLLVLDGGPCRVGIESTIVDCTRGAPVLLRPGGISREQVEAACGRSLRSREDLSSPDPRASGTLEAHYAPRAKVRLMDTQALQAALQLLGTEAPRIGVYARTALAATEASVQLRRMPADAEATARELFAVLRRFDEDGVQLIWVERPPASADWEGVSDRLQRAAAA